MAHATTHGAGQGSFGSYLTGFFLAVILTAIPFGLVMSGTLPQWAMLVGVFAAAFVQIFVHLHYFLHLDMSTEGRWNLVAILYTAVIIVILMGGSVWIMVNLRDRLMDPAAAAAVMPATASPA